MVGGGQIAWCSRAGTRTAATLHAQLARAAKPSMVLQSLDIPICSFSVRLSGCVLALPRQHLERTAPPRPGVQDHAKLQPCACAVAPLAHGKIAARERLKTAKEGSGVKVAPQNTHADGRVQQRTATRACLRDEADSLDVVNVRPDRIETNLEWW
jgi:hypothetical protein